MTWFGCVDFTYPREKGKAGCPGAGLLIERRRQSASASTTRQTTTTLHGKDGLEKRRRAYTKRLMWRSSLGCQGGARKERRREQEERRTAYVVGHGAGGTRERVWGCGSNNYERSLRKRRGADLAFSRVSLPVRRAARVIIWDSEGGNASGGEMKKRHAIAARRARTRTRLCVCSRPPAIG